MTHRPDDARFVVDDGAQRRERYSEACLDHFRAPRFRGRMEKPNRVGTAGAPGRGRFLAIMLRVVHGRVTEVRFEASGCGATIAAGSALAELLPGRTLAECAALDADDVLDALDGLPPDKRHCAAFAVKALKSALE